MAGDFDGDGNDDIVFNDWTTNGGDTLWWGPGLSPASSKGVGLAVAQVPFAGDFDGDAKSDLFVNNYNAGGDSIWWGTSRSGFSTTDTGFAATAVTMTADYTYGVDGTRTTKQVNGGTVHKQTYSDDGSLPLLLRETSPAGSTYVVYGPGGQPIEQVNPDGTATWLHHDQLGSVRLATNTTNGTESSRRTFNAYGTVASQTTASGAKQPLLGYAGQYTDAETGYQYLRARHYDPTTGQFLTKDPLLAITKDPFGYAAQNPQSYEDPSGEWTIPLPKYGIDDLWDATGGGLVHQASEVLNHEWEYDWGTAIIAPANVVYGASGVVDGSGWVAGSEFCGPAAPGCAAFGAAKIALGLSRVTRGGKLVEGLVEREGNPPNNQCTTNDNLARIVRGVLPFGEDKFFDFLGGY